MKNSTPSITLENDTLFCAGDWTLKTVKVFQGKPLQGITLPTFPLKIDGAHISHLDTAGVMLIKKMIQALQQQNIKAKQQNFHPEHEALFKLIDKSTEKITKMKEPKIPNMLARLGMFSVGKFTLFLQWLAFIGEFVIVSSKLLMKPLQIKWKYLFSVMEMMGFRALPIIAFLSFLIGVVLTYQIGLELKLYGANIYIISLLGLAIFREFGPLITAIILSGRTASSFTAEIGLMQANEEVDALRTMGLSPTELLSFPRVIGMVLAMPILIVWSDIFGILGGMIMAKSILDINYYSFLILFPENVTLTSFVIGLIKAPVFALIIALVGCFHGFRVSGSSASIGRETTKSVVLSIFLIIVADAIFSVILSWWNI